jgi:CRISPR system Cascade subunit CasD
MMDALILRLDAPLMSFGAPVVDSLGVIQPYPALSMMTGMLGNALGFDHAEAERLERLQDRLRYAVRQDRRGREIQDFQTVDISKPHMRAYGSTKSRAWTTRGELENRTNQNKKGDRGPLLRHRDYWAGAVYTVALTLDPASEKPTLDDVTDAVRRPARPLFIGRKTCLPAAPLFVGRTQAAGWVDLLGDGDKAPLSDRFRGRGEGEQTFPVWRPSDAQDERATPVTDRRDWRNQIHVGERWIARDEVTITSDDTKDE